MALNENTINTTQPQHKLAAFTLQAKIIDFANVMK